MGLNPVDWPCCARHLLLIPAAQLLRVPRTPGGPHTWAPIVCRAERFTLGLAGSSETWGRGNYRT